MNDALHCVQHILRPYSSDLFVDITKIDMMKPESTYYHKIEGDSMQRSVLDFIFDVIYCVISDV